MIAALLQTTAPADFWHAIQQHWGAGNELALRRMLPWVLIAIAVILIGLRLIRIFERQRAAPKPAGLFKSVATDLGLPARDQRLLAHVAAQQALPTPLALLLSPATLDHHAAAYLQAQPTAQHAALRTRLTQIRETLFS